MKGWVRCFCLIFWVICCTQTAYAQSFTYEYDLAGQLEGIGADQLLDQLPSDAEMVLEDLNLKEIGVANLLKLTPEEFFQVVWTIGKNEMKKPLATLASVLAIVLLSALLEGLKRAMGETTLTPIFHLVTVLCLSAAISRPIIDCIQATADSVREYSLFLLSFTPIFTGVVTAAGQPMTAISYHTFLFWACQIMAQFTVNVLVPLLGIYLAFCMIGSTMPDIQIMPLAGIVKSVITWSLGFMLSIFIGLMSIQSIVANAGDSAATKTAKFLIGSFVPVVGSALSDAFIASQGCIKLLKTSLGGFGILAAGATFLPILLRTSIWYVTINLASAIGEVLGVKQAAVLLKSTSAALAILISVILCFLLMVIISTTILLLLGVGM